MKKEPNKILADRIRNLRKGAKLTQKQLAEKLHFTDKYISDLEHARRNITLLVAEFMATIFQCDVNYLIDEKFDKYHVQNKNIMDCTPREILNYCNMHECEDCIFGDYEHECVVKVHSMELQDFMENGNKTKLTNLQKIKEQK